MHFSFQEYLDGNRLVISPVYVSCGLVRNYRVDMCGEWWNQNVPKAVGGGKLRPELELGLYGIELGQMIGLLLVLGFLNWRQFFSL